MIYTICNEFLSVCIDSLGAQLLSVSSADGTEYLWQRDERYWADSAPVLFPYIARLYKKSYTYNGNLYNMDIHGFAAQCDFCAERIGGDRVSLILCDSDTTLGQYPFRFRFGITYSLSGNVLQVEYKVKNMDSRTMPFALGGHPGFNVPLCPGTEFEDYYLEFDKPCAPVRIGFTDELFLSGEDSPYPLEDDRIIRLHHSLFDSDAVILKNTAKCVTLKCRKSGKSLAMDFTDFDYFGIWHMPRTDAPYVCLEPWTSLPSRQGLIEELTEKADMIKLNAGEECTKIWTLAVTEMQ